MSMPRMEFAVVVAGRIDRARGTSCVDIRRMIIHNRLSMR